MKTAAPPDNTLVLFQAAVREHSRRLLTVARAIVGNRVSPEDVLQQALMNLYEHRARYDWNEPGPLMRRAVVNEALRALRHKKMSALAEDHPERSASPLGGMIDRETVRQVRSAIDRLPPHYRSALVLCEYENLAYTEIADALDASVPQIKTWLHRARRQLARLLQDVFDPSDLLRRPMTAVS
jgi:RNA polymerase sigma-70 factor (ECF subfamily)